MQIWLAGLVRQGLAHARQQPVQMFETIAAHMTAAHAPGIARRLREWPAIFAAPGDDWASRALEEMGSLQLLLNAASRIEELPAGLRASVRSAIGWPVNETEMLADPAAETVADRWHIVGQRVTEDVSVTSASQSSACVQRTWLVGEATGRTALCQRPLAEAANARRREAALAAGTVIDADLTFYPGPGPAVFRASVTARRNSSEARAFAEPAVHQANFHEALALTASLLASEPWLECSPWLVRECTPQYDHACTDADGNTTGNWSLRDRDGAVVPLAGSVAHAWPLLAVSGGAPVTVFGEWDGRALLPLSVMAGGRFVALGGPLP